MESAGEDNAPIISTDELVGILDQPNLKILDCSTQFGRQGGDCSRLSFLKSHIKGAIYIDLDNLKDHKTELPYMLPNEKFFIDSMKKHNIRTTDRVVCYDTGAMQFFGYRAAWMFQAMGHPNVQVLDGGFPKWLAEKKPCESTDENASNDDYAYKLIPEKVKNLEQIKAFEASAENRNFQLLDARGPDQFAAGNIGGSQNFHFAKVLNMETKALKTKEERQAAFQEANVDLTKDIAISCMGGITASVVYGSLKDIATGQLSLYDGSWAEYSKNQ